MQVSELITIDFDHLSIFDDLIIRNILKTLKYLCCRWVVSESMFRVNRQRVNIARLHLLAHLPFNDRQENFERLGKPIAKEASISADQYLALRRIVSRSSARDERRTLATLMVSGPSSMDDISQDLGLNYSLGQRAVAAFLEIGVVQRRSGEIFAVAESALPLTTFGLRESMGLDLLNVLPKED